MRRGLRRRLSPFMAPEFLAEQLVQAKASVRGKVEYPIQVTSAVLLQEVRD